MNKVFTAPEFPSDTKSWNPSNNLFLAGSISSAEDWHQKAIEYFDGSLLKYYNIFNPRRKDFDVNDRDMEEQQICWEFQMINKYCKNILFWFSYETVAPITLYEYGRVLANYKNYDRIFVGIHPEYKRKRDVEIQTRLALGVDSFSFYSSVEQLCKGILMDRNYLKYQNL